MWAPSLISSLEDSSLHSSLRQPAFDLIHTIIVSGATALIISMLKFHKHPSVDSTMSAYLEDDEEYLTLSEDVEEKDTSCWFYMIEPENSTEMALPIRDWLSSYVGNILGSFGWQVPTGSDDGRDGKESKNSIKASTMCIPLIKVFKRSDSFQVYRPICHSNGAWRAVKAVDMGTKNG
ncbi:hypothetical protein GIB67_002586 [Kingdonia uniflora]|uniref:Uncharacterized protein n=1 Tax=Kingdonia uniflora TaxID=39325 RepID=A0A7J7N441_9MAGN|nr:hypothetical protein GIB67_002586 [Kingdonia uniflora]